MGANFRFSANQRRAGVRVRETDRNIIEALIVRVAKQPGGLYLQSPRLKTYAGGRDRDTVFTAQILTLCTAGLLLSR